MCDGIGANIVNVTMMQSLAGKGTEPATWYLGWVTRIPLSAIQTQQSQEFHDYPDVPASVRDADGLVRWADWDRVECITMIDLKTSEGLRIIRIPYVPEGARPLPDGQ